MNKLKPMLSEIVQSVFLVLKPSLSKTKASCGCQGSNKASLWRKISLLGAFPVIAVVAVIVSSSISEEEHHRRPYVKYEYLRIRHKRFPWGDGEKSFFHNPGVNALADGYEEE